MIRWLKSLSLVWVAAPLWLGLGLLLLQTRFDGLYGQDAFAYFDYAQTLRAALFNWFALPPFFWPPGYPLLAALTGQGTLISLLAGGLTALFTTLWAREYAEKNSVWPLAAGLLTACAGQLWQSSAVVMADTTGLACATLGAWAVTRFDRTGRGAWLWLAALSFAWALLTRLIYGIVAIPIMLYALGAIGHWRHTPRLWAWVGFAAVTALVTLAPLWLAALTHENKFLTSATVHQWNPFNAFQREFITNDGRLSYAWPNGVYYALAPAHPYFFTPLLAGLIGAGVWVGWRNRWCGLGWLSPAWALSVWLYHAGDPYQNFRFTLAYLPPLALLAAYGWDAALRHWPRWRWAWIGGLALGLGVMSAQGHALTQTLIARKNAERQVVHAVTAQIPRRARLLTFNITAMFRHYSDLEALELYEYSVARLPLLLDDPAPLYVLLNPTPLETQWAARPLGAAYRWLRPRLTPLADIAPYTLYRYDR
jgi:4-amino-4-deoxy-L-arabinose transferase-like glycosyltransferase